MTSLEGPVSRYLNRRASVPIASLLARTPVTPNQVSVSALLLAFGALALLGAGRNVEGGVFIQFSSIVDGVDGDLARAKGMASRFGGVFDAVLDRFADAAIAGGLAWYAFAHEDQSYAVLAGMAAAVAFLIVSYSRARLEREAGEEATADLRGLASRDVRLLALAIAAVAGVAYWGLVVVGAASAATVAWRLLAFYRRAQRVT